MKRRRARSERRQAGAAAGAPPPPHARRPGRGLRLPPGRMLGGLAAGVMAAALAVYFVRAPRPLPRFPSAPPVRKIPIPLQRVSDPAPSPDGRWVALGGEDDAGFWDVYVMDLDSRSTRRLTRDSCEAIGRLDVSRDGRWIAFEARGRRSRMADVRVVPFAGGRSRVLAKPADWPRWNPRVDRLGFAAPVLSAILNGIAGRMPRISIGTATRTWAIAA